MSGVVILPLRFFLGVTFTYAALQKLSDPGFFRPGSATYIGTQITGFMRGSPIAPILQLAVEHAVLAGVLVIAGELAVGLAVTLGFLTRPAAAVGLLVNLVFFLSASWHVYPYFLGSDIVFVVAWLTLALSGPGAYALDGVVASRLRARVASSRTITLRRAFLGSWVAETGLAGEEERSSIDLARDSRSTRVVHDEVPTPPSASPPVSGKVVTRAEAILGALATIGVLVLGLIPRGGAGYLATPSSRGKARATTRRAGAASRGGRSPRTSSAGRPGAIRHTPTATPRTNIAAGARKVGNVSQIPANEALATTDPTTGDPALVIHTSASRFYAYDAICTHAGCTVGYDPSFKLIVCPCHGSVFDPTRNAAVISGPAPRPLTKLNMQIEPNGDIYLV